MTDEAALYGRGVAFPLRLTPEGRLAWSHGEANVRESIRILLLTAQGERLRRPDYGAGLERFLFEPNVTTTWRAIEEVIRRQLAKWEPRVQVEAIKVNADPNDPEAAIAELSFTLVATDHAGRMSLSIPVQGRST
ncbi:GPW/gp25 family protein [Roseateles sp. LYH14W]|uniref:GPW/gp25 family protein n=1 Tax=Pelomonas parva TaxID=3299032 RepID=A0ABW7EW08_9BURK